MNNLTTKLEAFHRRVCEALPGITVEAHPYDIGYWATRAKLEAPRRIAESADLGEFEAGCDKAREEMRDEGRP